MIKKYKDIEDRILNHVEAQDIFKKFANKESDSNKKFIEELKIRIKHLEKEYELSQKNLKEYEKIKKVGSIDDVQPTTVTNITPTEIQVLDPDTYMTVDLEKNDYMKNINIGQEINVIKLENEIYIII